MTPERWREVQEIFAAATERDPERRQAYVAEACANDPELRAEVESLLASLGDAASGFLESPAIESVAPEPVSVPLARGSLLGPYEVEELLGAGGMGAVYAARDTRLGRAVAVKVIPIGGGGSDSARLLREARVVSALNHPNIVTVHDAGTTGAGAWIAMERVEGATLRRRLDRGALPLKRLLPIAAQIADGLASAHRAGIVHRDLKPENVMVTSEGLVKILDFGIAKPTNPATRDGHLLPTETGTRPGTVLGTAAYMSPEQARGERLDFRSDQFSFGSILYEMATGERAFSRENDVDTLSSILHDEPPPIASTRPAVPAPLQWIVERCLSKEPGRRYSATDDLARDLATLRDRLPDLVSATGPAARARRAPRPPWRSPLSWVVIGAAAVAIAVALFLRSDSGRPAAPSKVRARPLTSNASDDSVRNAVISPDGNYVAYADPKGMHILAIDSDEARSVPEPGSLAGASAEWEIGPWLPNGTRFFANAQVAGQGESGARGRSVWVTSVLGGAPRKLRDDAVVYSASPDGSRVAFGAGPGTFGDREVWTMRPDGGDARLAYRCDDGCAFDAFSWLRGTDRVAYVRLDRTGPSLFTRDERGGSRTLILPKAGVDGIAVATWLSGGRLVFARSEAGAGRSNDNLWIERIDPRNGRRIEEPRRLTDWAGFVIGSLSATADGRRLAFVKRNGILTTYVGDVSPDGRIERVRRLTQRIATDLPVGWAPDGESVIFVSIRDNDTGVYRQSLDGESIEQLVPPSPRLGWPRLSPDGRWIVYLKVMGEDDATAPRQIYRVPVTGGPPVPLFVARPGTWILDARRSAPYCVIAEPTEDHKTLIVSALDPLAGRGAELVRFELDPREPAWSIEVSPDGAYVAATRSPKGPVSILSTRGAPPRVVVPKGWHDIQSIDWSADGKSLYVSNGAPGGAVLLRVGLDGDAKAVWTDRGGAPLVIAVESPNGRRIAMSGAIGEGNVWMMEGF